MSQNHLLIIQKGAADTKQQSNTGGGDKVPSVNSKYINSVKPKLLQQHQSII